MTGEYLLSAETTFSAAHTLAGVDMCSRMHGHNWRLRVTVRVGADQLDRHGMGVDFRVLEQFAREAVVDFEHRYLNELAPFADRAPSAEGIVRVVSDRIAARLAEQVPAAQLAQVELWELPQYKVVYRP